MANVFLFLLQLLFATSITLGSPRRHTTCVILYSFLVKINFCTSLIPRSFSLFFALSTFRFQWLNFLRQKFEQLKSFDHKKSPIFPFKFPTAFFSFAASCLSCSTLAPFCFFFFLYTYHQSFLKLFIMRSQCYSPHWRFTFEDILYLFV